jgi:hypothetical protein
MKMADEDDYYPEDAPDDDDAGNQPNGGLHALGALADGYKQYISHLKSGNASGISGVFGKPTFAYDESKDEIADEQGNPSLPNELIAPTEFAPQIKFGAVIELISGEATIFEVCDKLGCSRHQLENWLNKAVQAVLTAMEEE